MLYIDFIIWRSYLVILVIKLKDLDKDVYFVFLTMDGTKKVKM